MVDAAEMLLTTGAAASTGSPDTSLGRLEEPPSSTQYRGCGPLLPVSCQEQMLTYPVLHCLTSPWRPDGVRRICLGGDRRSQSARKRSRPESSLWQRSGHIAGAALGAGSPRIVERTHTARRGVRDPAAREIICGRNEGEARRWCPRAIGRERHHVAARRRVPKADRVSKFVHEHLLEKWRKLPEFLPFGNNHNVPFDEALAHGPALGKCSNPTGKLRSPADHVFAIHRPGRKPGVAEELHTHPARLPFHCRLPDERARLVSAHPGWLPIRVVTPSVNAIRPCQTGT